MDFMYCRLDYAPDFGVEEGKNTDLEEGGTRMMILRTTRSVCNRERVVKEAKMKLLLLTLRIM